MLAEFALAKHQRPQSRHSRMHRVQETTYNFSKPLCVAVNQQTFSPKQTELKRKLTNLTPFQAARRSQSLKETKQTEQSRLWFYPFECVWTA